MPKVPGWISQKLNQLKKNSAFLKIKTVESAIGARIKVDGKWVLNLCSNNYLGFADHPRIKNAAISAIKKYGIGPASVRTIAGTTTLHQKLEEKLAKFKKTEAVILFQSGFVANLGTIPALVSNNDLIFSDELNHASIIDACRLSKAEVVRYEHLNVKDLESKIKNPKLKAKSKKLIVTDGVFSMDGDLAPLPQLTEIAEKYDCLLMVDDAHGEGVLGKNGRGIVDHFNLHGKVDIEVGTLSKAFGCVGGYATGKKIIIDWLKQSARPFLFSSAGTFPDVAVSLAAVKILQNSGALVDKLWRNTNYFKENMKGMGFNAGNSQTPIVPVILGSASLAQNFSKKLFESGVFCVAIGYPTVAKGTERIRVMLSAVLSKSDLDFALNKFQSVGKKLKMIS